MFEILTAFIHGILLSLGLIIPLGVQNVFIFNQGASQPRLIYALPSVITAFVCDTILITLAVLGISLVVLQFAWIKLSLFFVGFCFLSFMGYVTWNATTSHDSKKFSAFSVKRQIYFALSVSLLNPHAIIDTIGVIGTSSLNYMGHHKIIFSLGCIVVSLFWFLTLAIMGNFTKRLENRGFWLSSINKVSAVIIWGVGLYLFWQIILMCWQ